MSAEELVARTGESAAKAVEAHGPDWIGKALDRAETKAQDVWPDNAAGKVDRRRLLVVQGAGQLRDPAFQAAASRQGRDAVERLLIRVGAGEDVGTATYAALEGASAEDLLDALDASTAKAEGAAHQRIEDAAALRAKLLAVGKEALTFLVPLLLASL